VNGEKIKNETSGKGISLKAAENPACNTWIYWKVIKDENGKVILPTNEKYYVSKADGSPSDEMESGLYFVGYVLKRQQDGYHYDGYLFEYDKPETPASPSEEPTRPSEEPVRPSEEPAEETTAPAEETENPAEGTTEPASETENPAEGTTEPASETENPEEETTEPASETESPAQEPTNASEEPATITPAVPESGGNGGSSSNGSGSSGSGSSSSGSSHSSGSRGGSNHISLSVVQPAIPQSAAETVAESEPLTEITGAVPMAPATGISTPVPMDGASPQTGDDRQMFMWEAISALSAATLGAYWVIRRKHSRKEG
nr:hypothetical protein [Clostridium sp.]